MQTQDLIAELEEFLTLKTDRLTPLGLAIRTILENNHE